jgi:hypothetical protein
MDLLACPACGRRFYVPAAGISSRHSCPHCMHGLDLALRDMASIPLDARWLGSEGHSAPDQPAQPGAKLGRKLRWQRSRSDPAFGRGSR